jgi:hypothetical protein
MRYAIIVVETFIMLGTIIIIIAIIAITISLALPQVPAVNPQRQLQQLQQIEKIIHGGKTVEISNSSKVCAPYNTNEPTSIAISTDRRNYIVGDALQIYIYALDKNGCALAKKVTLTLDANSGPKSSHIFEESLYSDSDPAYYVFLPPLNFRGNHTPSDNSFLRYNQFVLTLPGDYTLRAVVNDTKAPLNASTTFHVDNLIFSSPARILYVTIAFFAGLLIVIALGINNYALSEILRFICISGIIISVVLFFSFIDEPIGGNGPVGLVKKPMNSTAFSTEQWVINIGGTTTGPADTEPYTTGIQIPIYVVIFGIVGGYLRYLYKTSKLVDKALQEGPREKERRKAFYQSLEDLSLLFLSPLLAIAIWFVLSQWTPTQEAGHSNNFYILATVSFTVGLVTNEIVQFLIRLTESILRVAQKEEEKPLKDGKHTHTPS